MRRRGGTAGAAAPAILFAGSLALIPGLCGEKHDPARGVPPQVWALRQSMETEVTRDGTAERISPEQATRFREAADTVARWEAIGDPDIAAEVLYLLPRTWHWDQREALRDLLVLLEAGRAGQVLQAEATWPDAKKATEMRKQVMLAQMKWQKTLAAMEPAARVRQVLEDLRSGTWDHDRFGWKAHLNRRFGGMVLEAVPDAAVPALAPLAAAPGPHREFALCELARIGNADAAAVLAPLLGSAAEGEPGVLQAALRFHILLAAPAEGTTAIVRAPGDAPLDAGTARTLRVDDAGWEGREGQGTGARIFLRLGIDDPSGGRRVLLVEGDRATCVIEEARGTGPVRSAWRLRRAAGLWAVVGREPIR